MLQGQLIPESPCGIKHLLLNGKCNKWVRGKIQSQGDFIQNLRDMKMCLALEKNKIPENSAAQTNHVCLTLINSTEAAMLVGQSLHKTLKMNYELSASHILRQPPKTGFKIGKVVETYLYWYRRNISWMYN